MYKSGILVAVQVKTGAITSSFFFKSNDFKAINNASVPFPTPLQNLVLQNFEKFFSNIFVALPLINSLFFMIFLIFNDSLPLLYLDPNNPSSLTDVNQVLEIASKLLIVAGVFQLFDGIQAVVLGALRGMQDVNKPAIIIFLSYGVIGFPISYYLGFYTSLSMVGIWLGLLSGLFSSSLFLFLRFNYLSRKIIRLND